MEEAFLWYILIFSSYMFLSLNSTYTFIGLRNRFHWLMDARLADRFWALLHWLVYASMALTGFAFLVFLSMLWFVPFEGMALLIALVVALVLAVGFIATARHLHTRLFSRLNITPEQKHLNKALMRPKLTLLVVTYTLMSFVITYGLLHFWFTNQILP